MMWCIIRACSNVFLKCEKSSIIILRHILTPFIQTEPNFLVFQIYYNRPNLQLIYRCVVYKLERFQFYIWTTIISISLFPFITFEISNSKIKNSKNGSKILWNIKINAHKSITILHLIKFKRHDPVDDDQLRFPWSNKKSINANLFIFQEQKLVCKTVTGLHLLNFQEK